MKFAGVLLCTCLLVCISLQFSNAASLQKIDKEDVDDKSLEIPSTTNLARNKRFIPILLAALAINDAIERDEKKRETEALQEEERRAQEEIDRLRRELDYLNSQ